jgi:hypothetical protein
MSSFPNFYYLSAKLIVYIHSSSFYYCIGCYKKTRCISFPQIWQTSAAGFIVGLYGCRLFRMKSFSFTLQKNDTNTVQNSLAIKKYIKRQMAFH